MASNLSWVPVVGSIGHHLMAGRSAVAHCWETRHGHWLTLMSEMDGKNLAPSMALSDPGTRPGRLPRRYRPLRPRP